MSFPNGPSFSTPSPSSGTTVARSPVAGGLIVTVLANVNSVDPANGEILMDSVAGLGRVPPQSLLHQFVEGMSCWHDLRFVEPQEQPVPVAGRILARGSWCPWGISLPNSPTQGLADPLMAWGYPMLAWGYPMLARPLDVHVLTPTFSRHSEQSDGLHCHFEAVVEQLPTVVLENASEIDTLLAVTLWAKVDFHMPRHGLHPATYSFNVLVYLGHRTQHPPGSRISVEGYIVGRLMDSYVRCSGFQAGTPVDVAPILVVVPSRDIVLVP